MTTREVVLDGGSPWGFRMHGGVDVQQPLRISRVNPGSKAAVKGVREGDIITSINNQPTRDITNADAHVLLKKSGDTLKLGLNEDCKGSPKRRQYKTVQQETHSESIERSSTSKTSYSSTTAVTINRNQSDSIDAENSTLTKTNGQLEKNDDPENGVISQRSTLSSTSSSSPAASFLAESRGIGIEIRQEARDGAARSNESNCATTLAVTKPVSADNEKDVIADTEMGGNSRSHKRRSRASRKKSKNSNVVVSSDASNSETMVDLPPCPLNSDVTERGNGVENAGDNITENAGNKVLERAQTDYRVESPETVSKKTNATKKQNGGTVVKSKSLDDDDLLKITELSEASEGEDKNVAECNAVVSEADSDVEWEVTEELQSEEKSEEHGECLSTMTLPLEDELETAHITLISPEDEQNLRNFLQGLNLVTSPDEAAGQTHKKEGYKERKARKRAAIAEHFMPVLHFPRYLDVIREEGSDNNNGDKESVPSTSTHSIRTSQEFVRKGEQNLQKRMETHFPRSESEKVVIVGGKLTEATNVQGTWSTSMAETSSGAEIVYIEDTSTSKTPSDTSDAEENLDADAEDEESKSEDVSEYSSLQESSTQELSTPEKSQEEPTDVTKVLPPPSQLTPPPTPDLSTPKNETLCERQQLGSEISDFVKNVTLCLSKGNRSAIKAATKDPRFGDLPEETKKKVDELLAEIKDVPLPQEDAFSKESRRFCDELNLEDPCKYVNAISPSRSPSVSSEGSSKSNSQCTARYNPMSSSIGDVADLLKDEENAKDPLKVFEPETLRELCLRELMSLPFGADVLEELAEVSQSIQELTGNWQSKISPSLQRLRKHFPTPIIPAFMSKKPIDDGTNSSFNVPAAKEEMPFNPSTKWVGMPTQQDPKVLVCLSPTQKSYLETTRRVSDEAGKLLELHQKFIDRRGYHEEIQDEPKKVEKAVGEEEKSPKTGEFNNRLLEIIRESSDTQQSNKNTQHSSHEDNYSAYTPKQEEKNLERFKARDLTEWLHLVRAKSASAPHLEEAHEFPSANVGATGSYQSKAANEGTRVRSSDGNTPRSTNIPNRRFSLPQEVYQRQIQYIREKEKQLQEEIEKLEKEKRKVISEMAAEAPFRQFEAGKYHISKKGDIAVRSDEDQPSKAETEHQRAAPMAPTEFFRQKMYDEYMRKVAAREERKMHKVIKITSSRTSQVEESTESGGNMCEVTHVSGIEDEFMDRVKERMRKYGLKGDDGEEARNVDASAGEDADEPVLVMDGDSLKDAKELPKHLQEFVDITRRAADNSEDETADGVWSPGQKTAESKPKENIHESQEYKKKDEPIPPVWTPRSAGSSPTVERKEFRPVNFESPVLGRKNKPKAESTAAPDSPALQPPWQVPERSSDVGVALSSSLERRIPTSHSAPASGFTEFSAPRLPRAQNPTITLLQKAREGQLPRGASYIQAEPIYSYKHQDDRPPLLGPGEVLYQIKNEYTSESDSERPRKMADLGPRKYEIGIGPTTKDGMPLVLRSEVREGNQSRWYKRMYDTIHKQKPDPRYPYASGYFSEPEHSAFSADYYDSDGTVSDSKYATLDRRRLLQPGKDKENEYISYTVPRDRDFTSSDIIRHGQDVYKNQPGRIENYLPGRSSISEKEAKEWWDEVMDIFDGWLDDHSALPSYNYLLSRAITRSHLEQQKNVPQPRGYMSQALKESGYESDSTLVFRRREDAVQQLSPSEQREVYKNIQKGGDVPLHGLRKPAPERPKEDAEIEYFPISPTLTRIRIHKNTKSPNQVLCYPLSVPPHPRHVFAEYKRSAPSSTSSIPKPPSIPPSPPKRRSSRNSNTLRLISTMKVRTERSPSSRRHETCFTSTSDIDRNKVKYLKDKITCKLSPTPKRKGESETKPRLKVTKIVSVSPSLRSSVTSTLSASKASPNKVNSKTDINLSKDQCCSSRSLSTSPVRKICKTCTLNMPKKATATSKAKPGTFGSEKRKVDLVLPKMSVDKSNRLSKSTDLLSPTEVKKAVISQINSLPSGTTYKKTHALFSSVKNGLGSPKEKSLSIQVGFSQRGRELLSSSQVSASLPATPVLTRTVRTRNATPSPCPSEKSKDSSQKSQSASLDSLKSLKMFKRDTPASKSSSLTSLKSTKNAKPKTSKDNASTDSKKLRKSKKDQLNGEIVKREKKTKMKPAEKSPKKCAGKAAGTEIVRKLQSMEERDETTENIYAVTQDAIQKQREAIQTNSFFQHLFWRDIPLPPPSVVSQNSWIAEKTRVLQRQASSFSEPTIGALKIYLNHTKPVTDSKFRSLDAALVRSRSASPKCVTWKMDKAISKDEKPRSISLPPKLIFTETSRPISPILVRRHTQKLGVERRKQDSERSPRHGSPSKLFFSETGRSVSPVTGRKTYPSESSGSQELIYSKKRTESPSSKMIFTETSRPISPVVQRRIQNQEDLRERSSSPSKLIFSETSRPVSPIATRKYAHRNHDCGVRKSASISRLIFSETSRPVSPVIERKRTSKADVKYLKQCLKEERERTLSPSTKLFFTETSRPVSPVVERRYTRKTDDASERGRSPSPFLRQILTDTSYSVSPVFEKRHLHKEPKERSSSPTTKLIFTETTRPVCPVIERRYVSQKTLYPLEAERTPSPSSKLFFTETSRPVSPVVERRYVKETLERGRSFSPSKLIFAETSRSVSPVVEKTYIRKYSEQERSFSPVSKLFFSETSRPVSPVVQRKPVRASTPSSPTMFRSPSSRRITQTKTSRAVEELKRRPIRSRSADDAEELTFDDDAESIASTDLSQKEYKTYFTEILHSPRRCSRFKELNKFYSTLERMGELERTTSSSELRPRRRNEEEIIDFDRWKEVHTRERAEKELETLYIKLKDDQKEKGFLFRPKDVEAYRWKKEFDRGLRIKDKSVENIKDSFEKLKEDSYKSDVMPDEIVFRRDLYKPLWRGSSVADLASSMVERRSQSEGRITAIRKKLLESERLLTHGIGSRIWSSLSSEQINLLKGQLAEIYSHNGQRKYRPPLADYSIDVSAETPKSYTPKLSVRRNSDELIRRQHVSDPCKTSDATSTSLVLSENEKKRLSQSLSREVMDRVSQRQKHRASLSLVLGKETRGAIAAAEAKKSATSEVASPRTCYSLEMSEDEKDRKHKDSDFVLVLAKDDTDAHKNDISATMEEWAQPKKALVSTDVTNRVTSASETESGSTDESTKTVVYLGNKDVQKKVEYFEQVAEERPYTPTIYRAADNHNNDGEPTTNTQQELEVCHTEELRQPRKLVPSQSYQDFKELFGEQGQNKFTAAAALTAARPPPPNSASSNASTSKAASNESLSPNQVVRIMRTGEVRHLKNKFEHLEDFYSHRLTSPSAPRRSRSDPELNRKHQIVIPGQASGEVDTLRRKYEYPWIFSRGRSRIRRGGVVSPIHFRAEDRYMPHINIISKIASLYPKKTVFLSDVRQKSAEELAKILGCPLGEVERLRQKFDSPERNISLLGHMFTSSPNVHELRDIAPYLTGPWTAHKYPKMEDNTRSLSSPENIPSSRDTSSVRKDRSRPKSASPPRLKAKISPILKSHPRVVAQNGIAKRDFDPRIHQPVRRYQPPCPRFEPVRYKSSWPQTTRPSVTFKGVVF